MSLYLTARVLNLGGDSLRTLDTVPEIRMSIPKQTFVALSKPIVALAPRPLLVLPFGVKYSRY